MSAAGLVVIGGLPGTGKSSIAGPLARRLGVPYLRIDTIEQALLESAELPEPPGEAGYLIGYGLAGDQIRLGLTVIVECVNPVQVTRDAWRSTAEQQGGWIVEVETTCRDDEEHRRRVETRTVDIPGLVLPSWQQVLARQYDPWDREHLTLDTSVLSVAQSVAAIVRQIELATKTAGPPMPRP